MGDKSPGKSYRLLKEGEIICKTDEFLDDDGETWLPMTAARITIGLPYVTGFYKPMRRKEP